MQIDQKQQTEEAQEDRSETAGKRRGGVGGAQKYRSETTGRRSTRRQQWKVESHVWHHTPDRYTMQLASRDKCSKLY